MRRSLVFFWVLILVAISLKGMEGNELFDDVYLGLKRQFEQTTTPNNQPDFEQRFSGPIGFKGSLLSEVSYSPELQWVAGNRLQLFTDIILVDKAKVYIHLGGWMPKENGFQSFAGRRNEYAKFAVKRAFVQIDGPWLKGSRKLRTIIGDLMLNYSPYTIQLDHWDLWNWDSSGSFDEPTNYNHPRRGISIETLERGKFQTGTFLLWEDDLSTYSYGGKLSLDTGKATVNLIYANYLDRRGIPQESNENNKQDVVYSIDSSFNIGAAAIGVNYLQNRGYTRSILNKSAKGTIYNLTYPFGKAGELSYRRWDMDKDFDPIYRDRTPKYDPITNKRLAWNPIDRLGGRAGSNLNFKLDNKLFQMELEYGLATKNKQESLLNETLFVFSGGNKLKFSIICEFNSFQTPENSLGGYEQSYEKILATSVSYPLEINSQEFLTLEWNYRSIEAKTFDKRSSLLVYKTAKSGPFEGARFFIGGRKIEGFQNNLRGIIMGADYQLADAIDLVIRYASPNEREKDNYDQLHLYDEYGLPAHLDNVVKISVGVDF